MNNHTIDAKNALSPYHPNDILHLCLEVLDIQCTEIEKLKSLCNHDLFGLIDFLYHIKGRLVVTGMGKSGMIAKKFAATLASTGTLAYYVHPAEASHGDLGMIAKDDCVIALSNSGETAELSDIIAYCKLQNIPLVGITGNDQSTLATTADRALCYHKPEEACPLNLAPTTSTTIALVLCDMIAMTLLKLRGLTSADFRRFHPGGSLGQRLLKVQDVMHVGDAMPIGQTGMKMGEAICVMSEKHFGCVGVMDGHDHLCGIITDGDLRRHMGADLLDKNVDDIMTRDPMTIRHDATIEEALSLMQHHNISGLFVMGDESSRAVGYIHIHDCLRLIGKK